MHFQTQFMCQVCSLVLNSKRSLSWHQRQQHPNLIRQDTIRCGRCGKMLNKQFATNRHHCRYQCPQCKVVCTTRIKLNAHLREHRNEENATLPFKCTLCNKRFSQLKYRKQHERTCHVMSLFDLSFHKLVDMRNEKKDKKWNCFLCERKLLNYSMLKAHMLQHKHTGELATGAMINQLAQGDTSVVSLFREEVKPLADICLSKLAKPTSRSNKEFACKLCMKSRLSHFDLLRHMQIHLRQAKEGYTKKHGKRKFICPHCFRRFGTEKNRDIHINVHHLSMKLSLRCTECNRDFKTMFNLERHMALHEFHNKKGSSTSMLRKFKCIMPGCNSSYSTEEKLNEHLQEPHEVKEESKLTEQIKNSYDYEPKYKKRKQSATKRKTEVTTCSSCGKTFANTCHLKRHLKLHEANSKNLRPFQCEKCPSSFGSEAKLKLHVEDKHEQNPEGSTEDKKEKERGNFICHFCGYRCSSNYNLGRHETRYHSETPAKKRGRPSTGNEPDVEKFRRAKEEYVCPICTRVTKSAYSFRRHVRIHGEFTVQNGETVIVLDENLEFPEISKFESS